MKTFNTRKSIRSFILLVSISVLFSQCTREELELELAGYPVIPEVFIDTFSPGLNYAAFGGSKPTAFDVDTEVKYAGSASMRIDVPDFGDPEGAYAGGAYFTSVGRDLSGYNVLTFWAKASQPANIDVLGFGVDLGTNQYQVTLNNAPITTAWKKYFIPLPDPSVLTAEKGMFYYSEGPENGRGYTFWIDEVKFENLGTVAHIKPQIYGGQNASATSFNGGILNASNLGVVANLPNGVDQFCGASLAYFTFESSNEAVAAVSEAGQINVLSAGVAVITGFVGGIQATGTLTITSQGEFNFAPVPTKSASDVISIFSDAYTNVPVDFYNGFWEPFQTTLSEDFIVNGDNILNYTNFNFVGTMFSNPTVNASAMTHLHLDVYVPGTLAPGAQLKITLRDFGANGADGGGDDTNQSIVLNSTNLSGNAWRGINIPLSITRSKMGLIIYENNGTNFTNFYVDNLYFYR